MESNPTRGRMTRLDLLPATAALIALAGCAGSSTTTDLSAAVPLIGITSPTAETSSSSAVRAGRIARAVGLTSATTEETKAPSVAEAKEELKDILAATDATKCFEGVVFQTASPSVSCYGPELAYTGHPDGTPSGGGSNPTCPAGAYCLPSGDLGIWSAAESSGEACAAAQMNSLTTSVSAMVNTGLKVMAGSICAAEIAGLKMPAVGESTDIKSAVATALPKATLSSVSLKRKTNDGSNPVYELSFVGSIPGTTTATAVNLTLQHSPASASAMKGRLYGTLGLTTDSSYAFALSYSKADSVMTFVSKSASIATAAAAALEFEDGDYDFSGFTGVSGSGTSGNARYIFGSINETTNTGTIKFAWQAGGNDPKARVFHAHTEAADDGSASGFAYFGFGPSFSEETVGEIGGMCCNWAGPGNACGSNLYNASGEAQKQVLTRAAGATQFTASSSSITYAPTNTCAYTNGSNFHYGTVTEWNAGHSDHATVAKDFVPYSSASSDYTTYIGTLTTPSLSF